MGLPGTTELLIIFGVLVLLFGANKLPKLGGAIGESIKNFKKGIKSSDSDEAPAGESEGGDQKIEGQAGQQKSP